MPKQDPNNTPEKMKARAEYVAEYLARPSVQADMVAAGETCAMLTDQKDAWVEDLRTTKAPQVRRALWGEILHDDGTTETGYCCLGRQGKLAGLVAAPSGGMFSPWRGPKHGGAIQYPEGHTHAFYRKHLNSFCSVANPNLGTEVAAEWNDSKSKTFPEIAELAQKHIHAIPTFPGDLP